MYVYIYIEFQNHYTFLEDKFQLEFNLNYMNNINNIKQCEHNKYIMKYY